MVWKIGVLRRNMSNFSHLKLKCIASTINKLVVLWLLFQQICWKIRYSCVKPAFAVSSRIKHEPTKIIFHLEFNSCEDSIKQCLCISDGSQCSLGEWPKAHQLYFLFLSSSQLIYSPSNGLFDKNTKKERGRASERNSNYNSKNSNFPGEKFLYSF